MIIVLQEICVLVFLLSFKIILLILSQADDAPVEDQKKLPGPMMICKIKQNLSFSHMA